MSRSELTEDSTVHSKIAQSQGNGNKKPHIPKENDPKYMNAIRPYVKDRKVSKRQSSKNMIPHPCGDGKVKPKKNQNCSSRVADNSQSKNVSDIYSELMGLKKEYKGLKESYNSVVQQNRLLREKESDGKRQLQRVKKQKQKYKNNTEFIQKQIERIKKECYRLLDSQKLKNKKLQQTIQEKQLMIAYLRSQQHPDQLNAALQHNTAPTFLHVPSIKQISTTEAICPSQLNALSKISINHSAISVIAEEQINLPRQIPQKKEQPKHIMMSKPQREYIFSNEEDSLSFSRDKSKQQLDSFMSISEPTILTIQNKEEKEQNSLKQEVEAYTGEEQLPTFENRYGNKMMIDPVLDCNNLKKEEKEESKGKIKGLKISLEDQLVKKDAIGRKAIGKGSNTQQKHTKHKKPKSRRKHDEIANAHARKKYE